MEAGHRQQRLHEAEQQLASWQGEVHQLRGDLEACDGERARALDELQQLTSMLEAQTAQLNQ